MGRRSGQKRRLHAQQQQQKRERSPTASDPSSAEYDASPDAWWNEARPHGPPMRLVLTPATSRLVLEHRARVLGIANTATAAMPPISNTADIVAEPLVTAQNAADVELTAPADFVSEPAALLAAPMPPLIQEKLEELLAIVYALKERVAALEARGVELGSASSPAPAPATSDTTAPATGAEAVSPAPSAPAPQRVAAASDPEPLGPRAAAIETSLQELLLQMKSLAQQLVAPPPVPPEAPAAAPNRPAAPTTSWAAKAAAAPVATPAPTRHARGSSSHAAPFNHRLHFVVVAAAGQVPAGVRGKALVAAIDSTLHAYMAGAEFTIADARRIRPEPARGAEAPRDRFLIAVDRMWEADSLVAHRHMLKGTGVVVFDHLSREEQVAHARLLPAFRQAQASGAKAQFQRARLFVDRVEVR